MQLAGALLGTATYTPLWVQMSSTVPKQSTKNEHKCPNRELGSLSYEFPGCRKVLWDAPDSCGVIG